MSLKSSRAYQVHLNGASPPEVQTQLILFCAVALLAAVASAGMILLPLVLTRGPRTHLRHSLGKIGPEGRGGSLGRF